MPRDWRDRGCIVLNHENISHELTLICSNPRSVSNILSYIYATYRYITDTRSLRSIFIGCQVLYNMHAIYDPTEGCAGWLPVKGVLGYPSGGWGTVRYRLLANIGFEWLVKWPVGEWPVAFNHHVTIITAITPGGSHFSDE